MKKSRITKLALLGASTLALVGTLSTSTYAWYVSNQKASVDAYAGQTNSSSASGSISVSTTGNKGDFYKSITLSSTEVTGTSLTPVVTKDGKTFLKIADPASNSTTTTTAAADSTSGVYSGVFHYTFYIVAEAGCTVIPSFSIVNTTGTGSLTTVPTQINYSKEETSTVDGVEEGKAFTVDAIDALHISQFYTTGTAWTASTEDGTAFSAGSNTQTAAGAAAVPGSTSGNFSITKSTEIAKTAYTKATGGAQDYYEEMTGWTLSTDCATEYTSSKSISNITLAANTPVKLEYYLWLDGADDMCFNSCAGQGITVAFDYTVSKS